jgi:hypothetical protein
VTGVARSEGDAPFIWTGHIDLGYVQDNVEVRGNDDKDTVAGGQHVSKHFRCVDPVRIRTAAAVHHGVTRSSFTARTSISYSRPTIGGRAKCQVSPCDAAPRATKRSAMKLWISCTA